MYGSTIVSTDELDQIDCLLQYEGLSLWLAQRGLYSLMAITPCRYFHPPTCSCLVHARDQLPKLCQRYSPIDCYYRRFTEPPCELQGRFDLARWRRYRPTIGVSETGFVFELPPWEHTLDNQPAEQQEQADVTLFSSFLCHADLPAGMFGDYLYYASGFQNVSLVRTEYHWSILFKTRRPKKPKYILGEVIDGLVLGHPRSEQYRTSRAEIASLYRQCGPEFCQLTIDELARTLRRSPPARGAERGSGHR
ncbi:MAG: hypothetical protein JW797_14375 [Bradymonadales bacterium]|nr:hypothetical protein [Bradymonadales bacterium]